MNKSTYRKTLDVQKQGIQFTVNAVKNEALSRQVILNIVDGGKPFDFDSDNLQAVLYAIKPDGTKLYNSCVRSGNTLTYTFTEQTLSSAGDVIARIKIIAVDRIKQVLYAPQFIIHVDDVEEFDAAVESTNEYTGLTTATANALSATSMANSAADNANLIANTLNIKLQNGEFKGEKGEQGEQGIQGEQGPPGKDAVIDLALSLESDNAIANSAATQAINENAKALEEAKKQLKSPRIQINEDVCVVSDMEDGTYEIANSKGSADIKVSAEGNVKMTLQNGELFSIKTDNQKRSISIFTGNGCWYIYDFDNENEDWSVCYCLTYDEASELIAEHIKSIENTVKNDLRNTNTKVAEALTIAKGKNRALVFTTFKELNDWINGEFVRDDGKTTADLQVGDNLYIVEVGVPDYWWDGNTIQVLETQKVDLSEYATKDNWIQLCDDTLEEDVSYILKTVDEQGNPFKFKRAVIYIYAPIAAANDGLIIKCTDSYNGATEALGHLGYANNVISTSYAKHTLVKIDASSGLFTRSSYTNGTTQYNMNSNMSNCINTLYTSIEKLLLRTNNSNNVFPAGTRIRIWGC